ncbi:hypothetical protein [Ornithinimicrobium cryptoxanthini]|uniref:Uncharacterized protein n=1 Tax=Ornithinimicrobium cryptoxanthini TaxID=2934161 RepID=A0ABY4YIQ6_9MICO|nr:hypothetical protein [Ornithinimicrobium cryptoxanthini]USQ76678.1 hypothetical protein NF557_01730 [Ornithinimicrobium cryptoxanthini]
MSPPADLVGTTAPPDRRRGWSPPWATVVAVVGAAIALIPLWFGVSLLLETKPADDDGFGTAIGQVAVVSSLVVIALLAWFLARGGVSVFIAGTALVALGLAWFATLYL